MHFTITPEYLASQGLSASFERRFWKKVFILTYDRGCWLWTASLKEKGYGQMFRRPRSQPIRAHVASWILHLGPVPKGLCVLHRCDNPSCVNPSHLWVGTQKQNTQDMMAKGRNRHGICAGESQWKHKLTAQDVLAIRSACKGRPYGMQIRMANKFGVSRYTVHEIVTRMTWKHI